MLTEKEIYEFDDLNKTIEALEQDIKADRLLLSAPAYQNSPSTLGSIRDRIQKQEQLKKWLEQLKAIRILLDEYKEFGGGFHYQVGRVFDGDYVLE